MLIFLKGYTLAEKIFPSGTEDKTNFQMKNFFLFLLLAIMTVSCLNNKPSEPEKIEYIDIVLKDSIGRILDIAYFEKQILVLDNIGRIFIVDLEKMKSKQLKIKMDSLTSFYTYDQSIFLCQAYKRYFKIKEIDNQKEMIFDSTFIIFPDGYGDFNFEYEDASFRVTSCCVGEWGGSVFFEDKKTNIIYTTVSTCVQNIDTFQNSYYIFNYLGHMGSSSSIIKISDVRSLPIYDKNGKYWCNWYYDLYKDHYHPIYHDSLEKVLLGETEENEILLDTFSLGLAYGGLKNSIPILIYKDDYFLKIGNLENQSIKNEMILLDSLPEAWIHSRQTENKASFFMAAQSLNVNLIPKHKNSFDNFYIIHINKENIEPVGYHIKMR